ncbi:MAG: D-aminoacyl-tRNA deacylase [candidate division KSB1 bacterium]|nr:D-aminoacyl-tRNA deacylase [candidate division KSB1 bacterium]MDZ7305267.1 D-aminoacyl-tRNA deacylase [candidate division KSB1 bacterium]MDZ7312052.1 D-aminoacyl-tRNA deacylase [candidate division KSB1 bacterium]
MRALIQRVTKSSVSINGKVVGAIDQGLVILLGIREGDTEEDARYLAEKCVHLRIFADENSKFNRSLLDVGGGALVISQFTLYGDTRKGRRPGFEEAARPEIAESLYNCFVRELRRFPIHVAEGIFGAMMLVEIHNDGPVTFMLESKGQGANGK